jgi:multidrug efflux system membrane fusion protein
MELEHSQDSRPKTIRNLRIAIVSAAVVFGLLALFETNRQPRTDDAEVVANFIGIAPQVEGPIIRLSVRDNQFVKKGELLFEIDDRPFRYALERAQSEQAALEGQISDDRGTGSEPFESGMGVRG